MSPPPLVLRGWMAPAVLQLQLPSAAEAAGARGPGRWHLASGPTGLGAENSRRALHHSGVRDGWKVENSEIVGGGK